MVLALNYNRQYGHIVVRQIELTDIEREVNSNGKNIQGRFRIRTCGEVKRLVADSKCVYPSLCFLFPELVKETIMTLPKVNEINYLKSYTLQK